MINTKQTFDGLNNDAKVKVLLELADRAPSTHNTQPWQFHVSGNSIEVHYDPALQLPEGDPTGRDLHISLGCCIENLVLAATHYGVFKKVSLTPSTKSGAVATVELDLDSNAAGDKTLYDLVVAIPNRFNARGVFKPQAIPAEALVAWQKLDYGQGVHLHLVTEEGRRTKLAELTVKGLHEAYHLPAFRAEIAGWVRPNTSKKRDGIPGQSLRLPTPLSLIFPWMMKTFDIGRKLGELNRKSLITAPAVAVISADKDDAAAWLTTGRLAERIFLEATVIGARTSVFVASVEIGDLYKEVQSVVETEARPQFLFCIGYIDTPQTITPRRPLEQKLRS